jgi:hypothetical protein
LSIRRHLSYANVAATLALAGVIGGGAAHAAGLIGSGDIRNNAVKSADLRNHKAVHGVDVKRDTLAHKQVKERALDASEFAPMAGTQELDCNPTSSTFVNCAAVSVKLRRPGRVLAIATGANYSQGAPANANCEVRIDGRDANLDQNPGEETTDNTAEASTDGFARTLVTGNLNKGSHRIALACNQVGGDDVRIGSPTLAVLGITSG